MVDRNISSHEAQASSVSDGTQGENAGVESVYARYTGRVNRGDYVPAPDIPMNDLQELDDGSGMPRKVFVQHARRKQQPTERPFKLFVHMERPKFKPRAVFNDEGQCEDSIFFTKHQIEIIYD